MGVNGLVWVRASLPRHVIGVGKVLERADQVSGTTNTSDALQVAKDRGALGVDDIARIVEPFK